MFWFFMSLLWVAMLLAPVALLVAVLPTGRDCPRCGGEALPIQSRPLKSLRRFLGKRWCTACGWEGVVRYPVRQPAPVATEPVAEPHEVDDDAAWRG